MYVLKGDAQFDERRNTSRVFPVPPDALPNALRALRAFRENEPALHEWIMDGHPRLTEAEHLERFGEPYAKRPRKPSKV